MLTASRIDDYRQRLVTLMRRIKDDLHMLRAEALESAGGEASGGISNVPLHPADLSGRQFEQEVNLGLVVNEEQIFAEADAALTRIEEAAFGVCESCHCDIDTERLDAVPYTRFCVSCAAQPR